MSNSNLAGSYYQNFSKYLLQPAHRPVAREVAYKYADWLKDPDSIARLKLATLKLTLKIEGISSHGNKPVLQSRLLCAYKKHAAAITIQKNFRLYIVVESERLKGPAYKDRNKCVNDTDFQTMDSVKSIPSKIFFSYANAGGFIYGFNVFSLMLMFELALTGNIIQVEKPIKINNMLNNKVLNPTNAFFLVYANPK